MSGWTWDRLAELFEQARRLRPSDRESFLDRECGDDREFRDKVLSMLQHASDPGIGGDTTASTEESPVEAVRPGGVLGPSTVSGYRILERLGEGGMGVVWLAEQSKPVRRRVALKIIKPGMDSKQVLARFDAERQALALMDHPNVAKVFDAGADSRGRPFFAMELVKGVPITEHCDRQRLKTEERLRLFQLVCAGVQHAHQKGIIHRDIKPSNVLVQAREAAWEPKIIDFGVAKTVYQKLSAGSARSSPRIRAGHGYTRST